MYSVACVRKTSPQLTKDLWHFLNTNVCKSADILINRYGHQKYALAMDDGLIKKKPIRCAGDGQQTVRFVPSYDRSKFGNWFTHDWFCFECHTCSDGPPLIACETCFRSFHKPCLNGETRGQELQQQFVCFYCLKVSKSDLNLKVNRLQKTEMNRLFGIIMNRLEDSIPGFDIYSQYQLDDSPKQEVLIYKYLDLKTIKSKIECQKYVNVEELENDFEHFVHNYRVYKIDGLNEYFESFLGVHFDLIKNCCDCFDHCFSNESKNSLTGSWFLNLCDPPHDLVYVKLGADPWWPAKVIRTLPQHNKYLVLCFAWRNYTYPIIDEVKINATRPIDFPFERKKYIDERIRPDLVKVDQHLRRLIDRYDPQNRFSRAIQIFEKFNIYEKHIPYVTANRPKPNHTNKKKKTSDSKSKKFVSFDLSGSNKFERSQDPKDSLPSNAFDKLEPITKKARKITLEPPSPPSPPNSSEDDGSVPIYADSSDPDMDCWSEYQKKSGRDKGENSDDDQLADETAFEQFLGNDQISTEDKFKLCTKIIQVHCQKLKNFKFS